MEPKLGYSALRSPSEASLLRSVFLGFDSWLACVDGLGKVWALGLGLQGLRTLCWRKERREEEVVKTKLCI